MTIAERYILQRGIKGTATDPEKNNLIDQYILAKMDQKQIKEAAAADLDKDLEKKIMLQIDKTITKALKTI